MDYKFGDWFTIALRVFNWDWNKGIIALHKPFLRRFGQTSILQYSHRLHLHCSFNIHDICPEEHFSVIKLKKPTDKKRFYNSVGPPPSKGCKNSCCLKFCIYRMLGTFHNCPRVNIFSHRRRRVSMESVPTFGFSKHGFRSRPLWTTWG